MTTAGAAARLRFGRFELQPDQHRLLVDGEPAALGGRALDLLSVLAERPGQLVGKHALMDLVWPGLVVQENNLAAQISALRKVLGGDVIATIPGRGYRFVAPLESTAPRPGTRSGGAPAATNDGPAPVAALRTNLPAELPALLGRADELDALAALVDRHRLVSIVGPGGIGKSLLAQHLLDARRGTYPQGVCWVELTQVADASRVARGDRGRARRRRRTRRALACADRRRGAADDAARAGQRGAPARRRCAALQGAARSGARPALLITSQAPLKLAAERVFRIAPLAVPASARPCAAGVAVRRRGVVRRTRASGRPAIRLDRCHRAGGDRGLSRARRLAAGDRARCGAGADARHAAPARLDARASPAVDGQPQPCRAGTPADASLGGANGAMASCSRASSRCSGAWASWRAARRSDSSSRCSSTPMTAASTSGPCSTRSTRWWTARWWRCCRRAMPASRATGCSRRLAPTRWSACARRASVPALQRRHALAVAAMFDAAYAEYFTGRVRVDDWLRRLRTRPRPRPRCHALGARRRRVRGGAADRHDDAARAAAVVARRAHGAGRRLRGLHRTGRAGGPAAAGVVRAELRARRFAEGARPACGRAGARPRAATRRTAAGSVRALPRALPRRQRSGPGERPRGSAGLARRAAGSRRSVMAGAAPGVGRPRPRSGSRA